MYFVMQVAKDGKYSSRAMRKVAEDSASKAINLFSEHSGGPQHVSPVLCSTVQYCAVHIVEHFLALGGDPNT